MHSGFAEVLPIQLFEVYDVFFDFECPKKQVKAMIWHLRSLIYDTANLGQEECGLWSHCLWLLTLTSLSHLNLYIYIYINIYFFNL